MSGSSKALAAAVTSYYQGQPLHVSTRSQPLDFAISETNYRASFEALKSSSHGGMFSEAGRASFRRADGLLTANHDHLDTRVKCGFKSSRESVACPWVTDLRRYLRFGLQ